MSQLRKIIHIDMDAFYASIEQRDRPQLKGKPIVVGGSPHSRGVVATCSYEARKFGIHSAMPSAQAYKLCPDVVFVHPRMDVYRQVSSEIMSIFKSYTELVEPLSLDEAFLDVTQNKINISSAIVIARQIKEKIFKETGLTASAGVSINKSVAKLASDFHKPDGLTIVKPDQIIAFLDQMAIGKFFGVGKVSEEKLSQHGILTGANLRQVSEQKLALLLGEKGRILYQMIRGIDLREVNPSRQRKSIGKETTLSEDIQDRTQMLQILRDLAEQVEQHLQRKQIGGRVITLKVKFSNFHSITRRRKLQLIVCHADQIMQQAEQLLEQVPFESQFVRLLGISLSELTGKDAMNTNEAQREEGPTYVQLAWFTDMRYE